jgi:hypothetical protein
MSDFKNELIKELIDAMHKVGFNKCYLEFYVNSETKPLESKENRGVENVPALLEEVKNKCCLAYDIKDTKEMSPIEIKRAYDQCAHWAQNPKKHDYGKSQVIYDIFVGGEAGDRFGKESPAMICYNFSGDVLFVLPHVAQESKFSLEAFTHGEDAFSLQEATISIYDFLKALKQDLDSCT